MQRLTLKNIFISAIGIGLLSGSAVAAGQSPSDLLIQNQRAARAWHAVVPKAYRKTFWVYGLGGLSTEPKSVVLGGVRYALGSVCEPHNCSDRPVAFLIALDGSRAVGVAEKWSWEKRISGQKFGHPNATENALLDQELRIFQHLPL